VESAELWASRFTDVELAEALWSMAGRSWAIPPVERRALLNEAARRLVHMEEGNPRPGRRGQSPDRPATAATRKPRTEKPPR
jgi:hypothetical protein